METRIIKGDFVRDKIFGEVKMKVAALKERFNIVPGVAFIGFNNVPLSKYNIPLHVATAEAMGFRVNSEILTSEATEQDVFAVIDRMNRDETIHAIVMLQPLPLHLNPVRIVNRIDPEKEVEGFHPANMIQTMVPDIGASRYPMCLPEALIEMFKSEQVVMEENREWVFLLDDGFIGNTLTLMIVRAAASRVVPRSCNVTFVNRESLSMIGHCRRADVLVVVTRFPEYIQPEWLKEGVCIIDIYSNLVKEVPSKSDPSKLVPVIRGGIRVDSVIGVAGVLLPIPGGLMTVVMAILFRNVLSSFIAKILPS